MRASIEAAGFDFQVNLEEYRLRLQASINISPIRAIASLSERVLREIEESCMTLEKVKAQASQIATVAKDFVRTLRTGGTVFTFGNGGSAADAQHIAAELVGRFQRSRKPYSAIALTTDTSVLTAIANDISFEEVFSRQVDALVKAGDIVVGISTSGKSKNVIKGVKAARRIGAMTIGLTGGDGGELATSVDKAIIVPSNSTQRIQEAHVMIGHIICGIVEKELTRRAKV